MFTIGDFARLGGLSVRMLRHYDALGLVVPARVDDRTGYRSYSADQLPRLNRLVALKDLGFSLDQVRGLIDDAVSAEELRGMLRLRHAELVQQIRSDEDRLLRVEQRLRLIEEESTMSEHEISITALPPLRVAARRVVVESFDQVGDVIQPLYGDLAESLQRAGVPLRDSAVALYETTDDGVVARAAFPLPSGSGPGEGNEVHELGAVERAATTQHVGPLDDVGRAWQALGAWVERNGHVASGEPVREVYVHMPMDDPASWVTLLQWPLR